MKDIKITEIIDNGIIQFYINNSVEDVVSMAKEEGFDPDLNADKRAKLVKLLRFKAQANLNKATSQPLLEQAEQILANMIENYVGKPISELKNLLQTKGLQVQFRNIDKLDEASIRDMLRDIDLVQLIEKLEDETPVEK
jgi:hypothetical protein